MANELSKPTSTYNPEETFKSRKKMYEILQQAQIDEHEIFEEIADKSITTKRRILEILSLWILHFTNDNKRYSVSLVKEMQEISNTNFTIWLRLQEEGKKLYENFKDKEKQLKLAEEKYSEEAPFGFVSGWFSNPDEKKKIESKKEILDDRKTKYQEALNNYNYNISIRQQFGNKFLRNCLANMSKLQASEAVGKEVNNELIKLEKWMELNWAKLKNKQQEANGILANEISVLQSNY